jgi:hypothetical protein
LRRSVEKEGGRKGGRSGRREVEMMGIRDDGGSRRRVKKRGARKRRIGREKC